MRNITTSPADILEVQEEIAKDILGTIELEAHAANRSGNSLKRHTDNVEAYHLYLKGRFLWNKHEKVSLEEEYQVF